MTGVSYALADFVTGGPILDLPVMEGASWAAQLNRPDSVSCKIDLNDPDAVALDLRSSSEPNKTVMLARNDDGQVLAWGLIGDDGRQWDEDSRTLSLTAKGVDDAFFGKCIIAPASALTATLITLDSEGFPQSNPALDTTIAGFGLGTIGKKLVEQRLAYPGAPAVFDLPADDVAPTRTETYKFPSFKRIGEALKDLTKRVGGPDFAFDAAYASAGLGLRYIMRHGTEAQPRIGTHVGTWFLGEHGPITGFSISDAVAAGASTAWSSAGKQGGDLLFSRARNTAMLAAGYPPIDVVDTSHNDVVIQATLDGYNDANLADAARTIRDLGFSVRADATPALGQYRPGDTVTLDVPERHPWHTAPITVRITSISGDEAGLDVKIGCVIVNA